jgi:hypothetical protein
MGSSSLGLQNGHSYLVLVFRDIFWQTAIVRLADDVSDVGDIHQLEAGPQTGICEERRGVFASWEIERPGEEDQLNWITTRLIVLSLMGKLYMLTIRIVQIERPWSAEGVSGECR